MKSTTEKTAPVLYIPHGGGPLPLLGEESHQGMVNFLQQVPKSFHDPEAIVVISAHWEEDSVTITGNANPPLFYDYYGFPEEAYHIQYPAPGQPQLAHTIHHMLLQHGISARLDEKRGLDHGVFVPLKLMYPAATIPVVQVSLLKNLDPTDHIEIGKALRELRKQNVLILGSGFSFHNMQAFFSQQNPQQDDPQNSAFQEWLIETCTDKTLIQQERIERLVHWENAPYARYCHPREEHLLPLHVCFGMTSSPAKLPFYDRVSGKKAAAFLW